MWIEVNSDEVAREWKNNIKEANESANLLNLIQI